MVVANRIDGTSQTDTGTKSLHHACMHAAVGIRMKMEAFTAKPASSTNFTHCLIVPDLLLACACALQTWPPVDDAGIGLKRLHLLSRETCAACDVQGYTLRLVLPAVGQEAFSASAHDLSDPKLCAFLSRSSLLRLHVSIPPFIQGKPLASHGGLGQISGLCAAVYSCLSCSCSCSCHLDCMQACLYPFDVVNVEQPQLCCESPKLCASEPVRNEGPYMFVQPESVKLHLYVTSWLATLPHSKA